MDFAHNPDGIQKLTRYTDSLDVAGRRIIVFSVSMLASDELIMATAAEAAGHFDIWNKDYKAPHQVSSLPAR
jgi:hypothetical protein